MPVLEITPSIKDASIAQNLPNENTGSAAVAWMGVYFNTSIYRFMIEFDIDNIPICQNINSASLRLYVNNASDSNSVGKFTPYRIINPWNENTVTWSNQPSYALVPSGSEALITVTGFYEWDVTEIVRGWVMKIYPNYGLLLKSDEIENFTTKLVYTRNEVVELDLRPALRVDYDITPIKLCSRGFAEVEEQYLTSTICQFTNSFDVSDKSIISFLVRNHGADEVDVQLQISPNGIQFIEDGREIQIAPQQTKVIVPYRFAKYMRLAYRSRGDGDPTSITLWYQGQV